MVFYSWKEMDEVCARGFRDAYNFIKREGIETCLNSYFKSYTCIYVNKYHFVFLLCH